MKTYYAYTRVSTQKQGVHGVSLIEQRDAIERHAAIHRLKIVCWFEERETAAKGGRPIFSKMLGNLRKQGVTGLVIHKIDRSARNLKDWADLGELIDAGVEVHFAADGLDLNSRGGRLSADIQAVVAADYIRNLRSEVLKGFYGRLKQGLFPLKAPIGYLDRGGGKVKVPDPEKAPLIRTAFELYASGEYSLHTLRVELARLGLRRRNGEPLYAWSLSCILRNPFYIGIIRIAKTGESFPGIHAPLVKVDLFERVQGVLAGKKITRKTRHQFVFSRLIQCEKCGRALVGERQKGRVYYRCHVTGCRSSIREDHADERIRKTLSAVQLSAADAAEAETYLSGLEANQEAFLAERAEALSLQLARIRERSDRLTDALIDGLIDKATFDARREAVLRNIAALETEVADHSGGQLFSHARQKLELAKSVSLSYEIANGAEKRSLLQELSSNFSVNGKQLAFTLHEPFASLLNDASVMSSGPHRIVGRTRELCRRKMLRKFVDRLITFRNKQGRQQDALKSIPRAGL